MSYCDYRNYLHNRCNVTRRNKFFQKFSHFCLPCRFLRFILTAVENEIRFRRLFKVFFRKNRGYNECNFTVVVQLPTQPGGDTSISPTNPNTTWNNLRFVQWSECSTWQQQCQFSCLLPDLWCKRFPIRFKFLLSHL